MFKKIFKKIVEVILRLEATLILKKYKPKIIGVTGSVGKTGTKEMVATCLGACFSVGKSEKSYNSEIGVPLAIIGRPSGWSNPLAWLNNFWHGLSLIIFPNKYPDWLVLEIGADRPGDIKKIVSWLKCKIAVITRLPEVPVHIEFFNSREEVIEEKMSLPRSLADDGVAILNADDENIIAHEALIKTKIVTYGFSDRADFKASNDHVFYHSEDHNCPAGITFKLDYAGSSVPVKINGALGRHHVYSALAALAVGQEVGGNMIKMIEALNEFSMPPGRLKIIDGIKETIILDDTYNASPAALMAGLETISQLDKAKRKIAVLGDMMELGEHTTEEHRRAGQLVAQTVDFLLAVGLRSKFYIEGAGEGKMPKKNIFHFHDSLSAGKFLQNFIKSGDVVWIKGSQSMRMEKAVEEIMKEPHRKNELLVRQERKWHKN